MGLRKLIMCVGLPGCGKTTWALEEVAKAPRDIHRVNKDDIRAELATHDGWKWSPENERDVIKWRDNEIEKRLMFMGISVISDDTNFARKHQTRLAELAKKYDAEFIVKRFDTPIEECIRRDTLREKPVGEAVIRKMAAHYHVEDECKPEPHISVGCSRGTKCCPITHKEPTFEPVIPNEYLMPAIICDLDGTLALSEGKRNVYDASTCAEDDVNLPVKKIIETFYKYCNYQIIYLSGREDKYRKPTCDFLVKHNCPIGPLYMRTTGDFRKDWIVKGELFDQHIRDKYNIVFVLDDRNQVVNFWRKIGLTCFQVADGDF